MPHKSLSICEMAVANLKVFVEPSLNLLLPNVIWGSRPENALGMKISAAVVSIVPAVIAPTLTLTSGLLSSPLIPLIGMVMNGMVNPSSTYNTHSKLRTNEATLFFCNSVKVTGNLIIFKIELWVAWTHGMWNSQGRTNEDSSLLACYAMSSSIYLVRFWRSVIPPPGGWSSPRRLFDRKDLSVTIYQITDSKRLESSNMNLHSDIHKLMYSMIIT